VQFKVQLLTTLEKKAQRFDPFKEATNSPTRFFAKIDFESRSEFFQFYALIRGKIKDMLKSIATEQVLIHAALSYSSPTLQPELPLEFVIHRLKQFTEGLTQPIASKGAY
jgi:hypothetical protein